MHRPLLAFAVAFAVATLVAPLMFAASYTTVTTVAGGPSSSDLAEPYGIAVTPDGDLIVADRDHHQIKRVTPAGVVSVIAGSGEAGATDGPAASARFKSPVAVAYDALRDIIYVADLRPGLLPLPPLDPSDAIRKIAADGSVSTLAATGLSNPYGLTVDDDGNVYVSDAGHNRIKKITPSGTVTTIAGTGQTGSTDGTALQARFNQPNGLAMTASGVLYIADQKNHLIRKLENGVVSTIAGNGSNGWVDGPALSAKFREPRGIAFDAEGNLIVADSNNSVIRRVTLGANSSVSTIAGNGNTGYEDGPPATAKFREPSGVVVAGAVFVADADNNAIRAIYAAPTLTSVAPNRGPQIGVNVVHLSGAGFVVAQSQVTFGMTFADNVIVNSQTNLSVTAPASVTGAVDVTVTTPGGTATLTAGYTYLAPPTVSAIQPAKGPTPGGTPVTITGTGFLAGDTSATIGGGAATAVVVTGTTQINATTPAAAAGLSDVDVTTSGGMSVLHNGFRYLAPPVIASFTPTSGGTGTVVSITGQNFDADPTGDQLKLNGVIVAVSAASATQLVFTVPSGATTGRITVNTAGGTAISATDFTTAVVAALEITAPVTTFAAGDSVPFNAIARMTDGTGVDVSPQATWTSSNAGVASVATTGMTTGHAPGPATVSATYGGFSASKDAHITIATIPTITPGPVDRTVVQPLADTIRFLYTGSNPVQTGVAANTIDDRRATTIRGTVHDRSGNPIAGVQITVLNHPEFGQTLTRSDGVFDMAVNGGGAVTIRYARAGYIGAQRLIASQWNDQKVLDDVVLIGFDTSVSAIVMGAVTSQIARGTTTNDSDGPRRATLIVPPGQSATIVAADGTTTTATTMHVRATEYTVGPSGPKAMPAALPATSGYTYCIELSTDEAVAAGAEGVRFSQPIAYYVDNFLHFPAGTIVPIGYFDRAKGVWMASTNGVVLQIVSVDNGIATIDSTGDGIADDQTALSALGITDDERQALATLYQAGQTLWRAAITHFSAYDSNFPFSFPPDATPPRQPQATTTPAPNGCGIRKDGYSIVDCSQQTLGESIPVAGSPYSLEYVSSRAGKTQYSMVIPLSGTTVPASLRRVDLSVTIAGRTTALTFPPQTNLSYTFVWDGNDAYGRPVQGQQPAFVSINYFYQPGYVTPTGGPYAWGRTAEVFVPIGNGRADVAISQTYQVKLGNFNTQQAGLAGWTLSAQQFYDGTGQTIYRSGGIQQSSDPQQNRQFTISTAAGNGDCCTQSQAPTTSGAAVNYPYSLAPAPDGSFYFADSYCMVWRVDPNGVMTPVAGTYNQCSSFTPDGQPALGSKVSPWDVAVGPDGTLYINDQGNNRVRKVVNGLLVTVAGNGGPRGPNDIDGSLATDIAIGPQGIAVGIDGSLYIAEAYRVIRVGPDGIATKLAGDGTTNWESTDGIARTTGIGPLGIAAGLDGSVYVSDSRTIRRISPDGQLTTIAGTFNRNQPRVADGQLGTTGSLLETWGLTVAPDGTVMACDLDGAKVHAIDTNGILTTIAGTGTSVTNTPAADGSIARGVEVAFPWDVKVMPDGSALIADYDFNIIRRAAGMFPPYRAAGLVVPSSDGSVAYVFDGGRHVRTINTVTGTTVETLGYDSNGLLTSVTDVDGNVTTIVRTGDGTPSAIIANGQTTTLTVTTGTLTAITNPAGESFHFSYNAAGLLSQTTDPRNGVHTFTYGIDGTLATDEGPDHSVIQLVRTGAGNNYTVTETSAEGRVETHQTSAPGMTAAQRVDIGADHLPVTILTAGATTTVTSPDSTSTTTTSADPRFGMLAPFTGSATVNTGSHAVTVSSKRSVSLMDPRDPFSLTSLTETTTQNGRTWTNVFNAASRTSTSTSPLGRQSSIHLDGHDHVDSITSPATTPVSLEYDSAGYATAARQGNRNVLFGYDSQHNLTSITDPLSRTVGFTYDDAGRVQTQTLYDGRVVGFTYDANGNVTSMTPPGRPAHGFSFTAVDLVSGYTPPAVPNGGATTYAYNRDKQPTLVTRSDGQNIALAYDTAGRLQSITAPTISDTLSYDGAGHVASIAASTGQSLAFSYDGALLTGQEWSGDISGSVSYTYDADLRVASENGAVYGYDADGLLTTAGALTLSRDPASDFLTGTSIGMLSDTYSYNSFGEPTEYSLMENGAVVFDEQYVRDDAGRIASRTETFSGTSTTFAYGYDTAGRLASVARDSTQTAAYTYNTNSGRATKTTQAGTEALTYDDQDRLLTYNGMSYTYTPNGELATKTDASGTTTYTYDALGNLRTVVLPDTTRIDYVIDGQNRRVGKKVNGTLVKGWLYGDQLRVVAELDGTGTVTSQFVYGTRTNVPDYMLKNGNTYRIVTDHLGSPRFVMDTTGNLEQQIDYDEFGDVLADSNPGFQPFGFAGGLYDANTGLARFGARDYDPHTGRWMAKDPIGFGGGDSNLYGYVLNDPVNLRDYSGLLPHSTLGGDDPGLTPEEIRQLEQEMKDPNTPARRRSEIQRRLAENRRRKSKRAQHHCSVVDPASVRTVTAGVIVTAIGAALFDVAYTLLGGPRIMQPAAIIPPAYLPPRNDPGNAQCPYCI